MCADLFYNIKLNPALAIFQIFASQMIGYGIAGLRELLLLPIAKSRPHLVLQSAASLSTQHSKSLLLREPGTTSDVPCSAFYPSYISVVNLLQSLHFGGVLNHKKRYVFLCYYFYPPR